MWAELLLVAVSFIMALLNASIGPCGGVLFATMAAVLPPAAVIPVHAVVQGSGTAIRFVLLRRFVDWPMAAMFVLGGLFGLMLGWGVWIRWRPPDHILQLLLGSFILATVAMPRWRHQDRSSLWTALVGSLTSFLTVFVGATGPLVAAWLARQYANHANVLGTYSACMVFQHGAKIVLFAFLGFSFVTFGPLLALLLVATAVGSWCGKQLLLRLPSDLLKRLLRVVVVALGVYLIIDSLIVLPFRS